MSAAVIAEQIDGLKREIAGHTTDLAPALIDIPGCGALTAAKIIGVTADVRRLRSRQAYARHNGTTPPWPKKPISLA